VLVDAAPPVECTPAGDRRVRSPERDEDVADGVAVDVDVGPAQFGEGARSITCAMAGS
jgi:hypothetical protein